MEWNRDNQLYVEIYTSNAFSHLSLPELNLKSLEIW